MPETMRATKSQAGIPAGVVTGILSSNSKLDAARGHGKLLYQDGNEQTSFETTAHTDGAFLNVTFSSVDHVALQSLADEVARASTPQERLVAYQQFGKAAKEILQKETYQKFKTSGGSITAERLERVESKQSISTREMSEAIIREKMDQYPEAVSFMLVIAGILASGLGGVALLARTVERFSQASEKQALKTALSFLDISQVDAGEKEKWVHDRLDRQLSDLYQNSDVFETYFPFERAKKLSFEEKKKFLALLVLVDAGGSMPYKSLNIVRAMLNRRDVKYFMKRMEADGVSFDKTFSLLASQYGDGSAKKEAEKNLPERVDHILAEGKKLAVTYFADREDRGVRVTPKRFFAELGAVPFYGDGVSSKKASLTGGGDFEGHASYEPGMDLRSVDWAASARSGTDKLYVKTRAVEVEQNVHTRDMHLVIDVVDSDERQLSKLVAFFHYVRHHRKEVSLGSVEIVARGERVDRMSPALTKKITDPNYGQTGVRFLIEKIEQLRIEHQGFNFSKDYYRSGSNYRLPVSVGGSSDRSQKNYFFVGVRSGSPEGKHLGSAYTFKQEQEDVFDPLGTQEGFA